MIDWKETGDQVVCAVKDILAEELADFGDLADEAQAELQAVAQKVVRYWELVGEGHPDAERTLRHAEAQTNLILSIYLVRSQRRFKKAAERIVKRIAKIGLAILKGLVL